MISILSLGAALPVISTLGNLASNLIAAGDQKKVIAGLLVERAKEIIERFMKAQILLDSGAFDMLTPDMRTLIGFWLAEGLTDAQAILTRAGALAKEEINVANLWQQAMTDMQHIIDNASRPVLQLPPSNPQ